MLSNSSGLGILIGALAVQLLGCEPYCPKGYDKRGGTCYRIRDSGVEDAQSDGDANEVVDGGDGPSSTDGDIGVEDSPADGAIDDGGERSCAAAAIGADCGANETSTACEPGPCEHGGACLITPEGARCDCTGTGYSGDKCEEDGFDECSGPNACTAAAYPCVQTEPPGYTCQGQFADWPMPDAVSGAKVKPDYDFTTNPQLVVDKVTGLIWQRYLPERYPLCTRGDDVADSACSWQEAKDYCAALVLGGSEDWRLPTRIELDSIYSTVHPLNGALDPLAFPAGSQGEIWSASPVVSIEPREPTAFLVALGVTTTPWPIGNPGRVRCVRSERVASGAPGTRYRVNASSPVSVTDTRTGLTWLQTVGLETYTWSAASAFCEGLGSGWRVPTKNELATLVDPVLPIGGGNGCIDIRIFPSLSGTVRLWTVSTISAGLSGGIDRVLIDTGYGFPARSSSDADVAHVRCVK